MYFIIIVSLLLSSCSVTVVKTESEFDPDEVKWLNVEGKATISGQSFARTQGGEVKTCAGNEVGLVPRSKYADERIQKIYGSLEKGYRSGFMFIDEADPEYKKLQIKTKCNAQGEFRFHNVPNGTYYLTSFISWLSSDYANQKVIQMIRVDVDGEDKDGIILSP